MEKPVCRAETRCPGPWKSPFVGQKRVVRGIEKPVCRAETRCPGCPLPMAMAQSEDLDPRGQSRDVLSRLQVLFDSYGQLDYIGEPVSIKEHSLQAAWFASKRINDEETILAALFHDIGHILGLEAEMDMRMGNCGIMNHEDIGADFLLKLGFSKKIADLVRGHVQAKRYLCGTQPEYYNELSEASKTTLGYQGGPMTAEECTDFKANPLCEDILFLRSCDEAAKVPGGSITVPDLNHYFEMICRHLSPNPDHVPHSYILSAPQLQFYQQNSYLKVTNLLPFLHISPSSLSEWTDEVASWSASKDKWIQHWELTADQRRILCRCENFVDYHNQYSFLAKKGVLQVVSQLFSEPAVLFKEKINHKLPGGAGFAAHQDSPAYIGLAEDHISVMLAIDRATISNGCLEVSAGQFRKGQVPLTSTGVLTTEAEAALNFKHVPCEPGNVLFFSGYIPHRSTANNSDQPRRAVFLTYNPASQGDHHCAYYIAKHSKQHGFNSKHNISFQGDFQGIVVD
jgi:2-aminoethylphosphonate dioxygenase